MSSSPSSSPSGRRAMLRAVPLLTLAAGVVAAGCTMAQEPWPNLNDAEAHLDAALDALHQAPDRFGGHKAEAVRLIREAYNEIELAKRAYR